MKGGREMAMELSKEHESMQFAVETMQLPGNEM